MLRYFAVAALITVCFVGPGLSQDTVQPKPDPTIGSCAEGSTTCNCFLWICQELPTGPGGGKFIPTQDLIANDALLKQIMTGSDEVMR